MIRDHSDDVAYEQAHVREFGEKLSRKSEVKPCCGTWRWPKGPRSGNLLTSSHPHRCFRASSSLRASSLGRSSASGASSRVYIVGKECKRTTVREASYSSHHTRLMSSGNVNIRCWLFTDPVISPSFARNYGTWWHPYAREVWNSFNQLSLKRHLLMDTSLKQTPRVGPSLSLLLWVDPL